MSSPRRRIVVGLVAIEVAIIVVIAATGNMHTREHHPVWVNGISALWAAIVYGLIIWGLVVLVRRFRRRRAHHGLG